MSNMQVWDADRAQARIRELERLPGALLPILHALQEEFGYIDPAVRPWSPAR
jgi:formate dehydrogenase subunit gamma